MNIVKIRNLLEQNPRFIKEAALKFAENQKKKNAGPIRLKCWIYLNISWSVDAALLDAASSSPSLLFEPNLNPGEENIQIPILRMNSTPELWESIGACFCRLKKKDFRDFSQKNLHFEIKFNHIKEKLRNVHCLRRKVLIFKLFFFWYCKVRRESFISNRICWSNKV